MSLPAFLRPFFIANYFYGLCAVALSVEAALQQRVALNGVLYHLALFLATVVFYTHAYRARGPENASDERVRWYAQHHGMVRTTQMIYAGLLALLLSYGVWKHPTFIIDLTSWHWALLLVFPLVGAAYYGSGARSLRSVGWLKPFMIGFVWAGAVTVYPVLYSSAAEGSLYPFTFIGGLLFVKNFMFISVLGILFDIKDHLSDRQHELRTFVVQRGLRSTIFKLVLPLSALGLGTFLVYGGTHGFSAMKMVLNTVPFVLLIVVAYSLRRRRSILYYLVVVDGSMLVKGILGSIAMAYF